MKTDDIGAVEQMVGTWVRENKLLRSKRPAEFISASAIRASAKCFETLPRAAGPKRCAKHFLHSLKPPSSEILFSSKDFLTADHSFGISCSEPGSFLPTGSMAVRRCPHTATFLPNGTMLLVGGESVVGEIHDPSKGSFAFSVLTEFNRSGRSATLPQNGNVLVVGGLAWD